jgi:transcriptional regulator GlxA family with amidase domain
MSSFRIDSSIEPKREARFVDTGDIITSAGISAGIDMALHLIVRLHSQERAREIKRRLQYEPEPPVE